MFDKRECKKKDWLACFLLKKKKNDEKIHCIEVALNKEEISTKTRKHSAPFFRGRGRETQAS